MSRHLHLNPVGGIAGDMFIAALADAFPECKQAVLETLEQFKNEVQIEFISNTNGHLTGTRFRCTSRRPSTQQQEPGVKLHSHKAEPVAHHRDRADHEIGAPSAHQQPEEHDHRSYEEVRQIIESASLSAGVRNHALNIFALIGEAEAVVHGIPVQTVLFHEVGGWDSIADVIGAACIIDKLGETSWSYSPLPIGGGLVQTAHGLLPVPVPATTLLLKGYEMHSDGVDGERVTPTGAAIFNYLRPTRQMPSDPLIMGSTGYGLGTRTLPGMSNVLRVVCYQMVDGIPAAKRLAVENISMLSFEIDDMTAEELAVALEQLRARVGVLDVTQSAVFGKKQRLTTSVSALCTVATERQAAAWILSNTTTLGVRHQETHRYVLPRTITEVSSNARPVRVKLADRPDGRRTAKAEIDDLQELSGNCFELRQHAQTVQTASQRGNHDETDADSEGA